MKRVIVVLLQLVLVLAVNVCLVQQCHAQPTFCKTYSRQSTTTNSWDVSMRNAAMAMLPGGGYLMAGNNGVNISVSGSLFYIQKVDQFGNRQWIKSTSLTGFNTGYVAGLFVEPSSNFVTVSVIDTNKQVLITRYNPNGDTIYTKRISKPNTPSLHAFVADNHGYMLATVDTNTRKLTLTKVDSLFNVLFTKQIVDSAGYLFQGTRTVDGGYTFVSIADTSISSYGIVFIKVDHNGDSILSKKVAAAVGVYIDRPLQLRQTNDNGFVFCGNGRDSTGYNSGTVYTTDTNFIFQWRRDFSKINIDEIEPLPNGGYILNGIDYFVSQSWNIVYFLDRLDNNGNDVWTKYFPNIMQSKLNTDIYNLTSSSSKIALKPDGGFVMAGRTEEVGMAGMPVGSFLLSTDSLGQVPFVTITGKIFLDQNEDCIDDSTGTPFRNWLVKASGTNGTFYGITDSNSNYAITADTGTYTVSTASSHTYWGVPACANSITAIASYYDTAYTNLPESPSIACPQLNVEIATPFIRGCTLTTYTIDYNNSGTADAVNSYVEILFDTLFHVTGSSVPWILPQSGNTFRFNVGNIGIGQSGSFSVQGNADCLYTETSQTLCAKANIYPDSICLAPDSIWDKSDIQVEARCENQDSVRFFIKNAGTGNMSGPLNYFIVEDNLMFRTKTFQLLAGQSTTDAVKANGATWTIIAEQSKGHPGKSHPLKSIEACGTNSSGYFSKGFVIQFPQDDQDVFVAIDCHEIISSHDPNEKEVAPKGLSTPGYINEGQPLKYQIHFQNTGTDTAFNITVKDTLSPYLDIATLTLGPASHPFTLTIEDSNVLVWTFNQILLPDSATNNTGSNGFFSFTINQKPMLAAGTVINNRAGIYFDNNAVMMTNTTINTIAGDYKKWLLTSIDEMVTNTSINVYPNPTHGEATVEINGMGNGDYHMVIYDLVGKVVKLYMMSGNGKHTINDLDLKPGAYLFEVNNGNGKVAKGKLMVL